MLLAEDAFVERGRHYTGAAPEVLPRRGILSELSPNVIMSSRPKHLYEFGPFVLDPAERTLLREGQRVRLRPKVFDMLLVLVENSGRLVEKEELMRAVWPEQFVEEGNLNKNVSMLREALGESPASPTYIETEPKRGYRFVAEVRAVNGCGDTELIFQTRTRASLVVEEETDDHTSAADGGGVATRSEQTAAATKRAARVETGDAAVARSTSSAAYLVNKIKLNKRDALLVMAVFVVATIAIAYFVYSRRAGGSRAGMIRSIAVLPFTNVSNNPDTEYLSDGVSENLINSLSQLPGVKVIARSSTFKYKGKEIDLPEVANTLGVEAILTGRVTRLGDNLLISVELVDARDKTQVWGGQYNRKSSDLLAVQAEISQEIADRLRLKLSGAERQQLGKLPTENLKAFQYYMQGRGYAHRRTREDLLASIRYCEKAIEEDRNYALAYAGLADAYVTLGSRSYIVPQEARGKAEEAAHRALALDENLAEAHAALGSFYVAFAPYNFLLSDRELRRAIELSPSLAMAYQFLGVSLARRGRLDEGLEELLKARELDPLSSIIARSVLLPYYLKRDYGRALELLRQANELGPAFTTVWEIGVYTHNQLFDEALAELEKAKQERKDDPLLIYSTGMVYAEQGRRTEALQIIKELEEMSGTSLSQAQYVAKIYAALNEKELALTWLERTLAVGAIGAFFKDEPAWDPIRSDPRFADHLRRMGIAV